MIDVSELAYVATLNNKKKILVKPNYNTMVLEFRYLNEKEMADNQLDIKGHFIWFNTPLHRTVENGVNIIFATVESTPIALHRY